MQTYKESKPSFSVVTVVLNNLEGLKKTLESYKALTYPHKNLSIVDGYSNDGTRGFLMNLNSQTDIEWVSERDKGLYYAMNKGLQAAQGDYIIFMNGGDIFHEASTLSKVAQLINTQNQPDVVYTSAYICFPKGSKRLRRARSSKSIWHGQPAIHQATYFKRLSHLKFEYDTEFRISADYNLIARMHKKGLNTCSDPAIISCQFKTDVHSVSATNKKQLAIDNAKTQLKVLELNRSVVLCSFIRRTVAMSVVALRRYFS